MRSGSYCDTHARAEVQQSRQQRTRYEATPERKAAKALYDTARWKRLRLAQLQANPLCAECLRRNRVTPAQHVDHIHAWQGDTGRFYDPNNLASMCRSCHSRKTATVDGGFGNRRRG